MLYVPGYKPHRALLCPCRANCWIGRCGFLQGLAEFKTEAFVVKFVWMSVGGALIGFAFGMGGSICLAYTDNGTLATIITLAVAYLGFFVADSMVRLYAPSQDAC